MTTKLRISDSLALPAETVTATQIVYGGKGMGKTNYGAVLAEELARAGLRFCVLDPMGVWWGLRHSKDGKGKGVECLILGGAHGDIPIEPTGGAVAADLVVDEEVNIIIDFSRRPNGETWGVGEKIFTINGADLSNFEMEKLAEGDSYITVLRFNTTVLRKIRLLKFLHEYERKEMWAMFTPTQSAIEGGSGKQMRLADAAKAS